MYQGNYTEKMVNCISYPSSHML